MKTISIARLGLMIITVLIQAMHVHGRQEELVADQSGTLFMVSAASTSSSNPAAPPPAATLPEAISTAPMATESFSTIQFAPAQETALILPVSTVFGPGQLGFLAVADEERDPFALIEVEPVPELSTGWTGLLVTATTILPLAGRVMALRLRIVHI